MKCQKQCGRRLSHINSRESLQLNLLWNLPWTILSNFRTFTNDPCFNSHLFSPPHEIETNCTCLRDLHIWWSPTSFSRHWAKMMSSHVPESEANTLLITPHNSLYPSRNRAFLIPPSILSYLNCLTGSN